MAAPTAEPDCLPPNRSESLTYESTFEDNWRSRATDISMIQKLIPTGDLTTLQELLPILERNSRALASERERSKIFWEALVKLLDMYKKLEDEDKKMSSNFTQVVERLRMKEVDLHKLQGRISVLDTTICRLEMSVQQLEKLSYDGVLFVEIQNYSQKKNAAMNSTPSFYSDDFYTSRHGYRMCARIYLNGDGVGKGTHLSIFFAIKKGRYDKYLSWPFQRRVTFTLLNQAGKDHLSDAFRPDPTSSSFQKPVKEMNIASGCPMFVAHKVIENPMEGFLKNNTICLRVKVEQLREVSDAYSQKKDRHGWLAEVSRYLSLWRAGVNQKPLDENGLERENVDRRVLLVKEKDVNADISDKALSEVSNYIGEEWKQIAMESLNLKKYHLDEIEEDNKKFREKVFAMFVMWRKQNVGQASPHILYKLLNCRKDIEREALLALQKYL